MLRPNAIWSPDTPAPVMPNAMKTGDTTRHERNLMLLPSVGDHPVAGFC
jgi:hypothetical protein